MTEAARSTLINPRTIALVYATLLAVDIVLTFTAADILRLLYEIGLPDSDKPAFIRTVRVAILEHSLLTLVHLFTLIGFITPFIFAGSQKDGLSRIRTLFSRGGYWLPAVCIGYAIMRLAVDYCIVTLVPMAPFNFVLWMNYFDICATAIGTGLCILCVKALQVGYRLTKFARVSVPLVLLTMGFAIVSIIYFQGPTRQIVAINRAAQSTFASARVTAMDRDLELLLISGYLKSGRYFSADFYRSKYPDRQTTDSVNVGGSPIGISASWHNDMESSKSTYRLETNRLRSLDNAFTLSVDVDNPLNESQKAAVELEANNVASQFLTQVLQSLSD